MGHTFATFIFDTAMPRFIVASAKPWHRDAFDETAATLGGHWMYVSTPDELDRALVDHPNPRYLFFLHWNWIVAERLCKAHECVCFHMTNVPYGRGGSPLQNLILQGQSATQVTALRMVREMDAGPVYGKRPMSLEGRAEDIYLRAGRLCWDMVGWMIQHQPTPAPQQGTPTFFKRRKSEQSVLPSAGSLEQVYDFVRMLDAPTYPLAFVEHGAFRIEFSHATLHDGKLDARVQIRVKQPA